MYISLVVLTGFRCHLPDSIPLTPYTCIIGRNDTGKSCMLRALRLLFDTRVSPVPQDLSAIEPLPTEAFVEATLVEVPGTWPIGCGGILNIRRRIAGGPTVWEVKGSVPKSSALRKMCAGQMLKSDLDGDSDITPEIKAFLDKELPKGRLPSEISIALYEKLDAEVSVEKVLDWGPIPSSMISDLFHPIYLSADSKAEEEAAGSRSTFNDLGGMLVREAAKTNEELNEKIEEVKRLLGDTVAKAEDGKWTYEPLNRMEKILKEEVARFDGSIELIAKPTTPTIGTLQYGMDLDVKDKHIDGLGNMGHGLRRSVIFAMLRTLARMTEIIGSAADDPNSPPPFRLFLIEEPELYLHPQAERTRMLELQELSERAQTQVVLCTHSAFFVDIRGYQNILRFAREHRSHTCVHAWSGEDLSLGGKRWLKMVRYFDANASAMLFADCAVLCEGGTEKVCIPALAERLEFSNPSFEIVDCGGSGNLETYQSVLEALGVPYVIWMDGDGGDPAKKAKADKIAAQLQTKVTPGVGHLVIMKTDWEDLAEIVDRTQGDKPYRSRKKFFEDGDEVPEPLQTALRAVYERQDLDMR